MTRVHGGSSSFVFLAARADGRRTFGMRPARSERALADGLRRDKLVLLRTWRLPGWVGSEREMKLKDHALLYEQLAQLLDRGVPLVEALEVAASVVTAPNRARVDRMRELVAGGSSFADACRQAGSFDRVTVSVFRAAERTGDLAGAARQLGRSVRRQLEVRGKAVTLLIYPAIVLSISIIAGVLMLTLIIPTIGRALAESGMDLPFYTEALFATGTWMRDHIAWIVLGVVGAAIGVFLVRRQIGATVTRAMRHVPMLKDVVLAQESARFFAVMGAMTRSGIPLADALGVAVESIGHARLRRDLGELRHRLIEGGVLRTLINRVESLPLATRRLLVAADQAGDLESAFDTLSQDMANEVDKKSARLMAALEPLLIVGMFVFIGSLIMAIMIPLISLTSQTM